jgi:predicted AlkP superfamily pyrophosphatase or phosphodiesterase
MIHLTLAISLVFTALSVAADSPRLVLVIAVDQLRADRLTPSLPGGLGELARSGRVFANTQLDHAGTSTCPGHAVMLTGTNPKQHGITGNEYFDRESWRSRYCVEDLRYPQIGGGEGRSPSRLQATTLGDWLKDADPTSRVFTVSAKDRAAITLGGLHGDLAIWLNRDTGQFTSSEYYLTALPDWLVRFNGPDSEAPSWLADYPTHWIHPRRGPRVDDFPFESDEFSRASPHPLNSGDLEERVAAIYASPYIDEAVTSLTLDLVREEQLGYDATPDLLAVSYSATDTVGHLYGPRSSESIDTLNRLDAQIDRLLNTLDELIGMDRVLVVLTADHGVLPLPEATNETGSSCPQPRTGIIELVMTLWWDVYWKFTAPFTGPWNLVNFAESQVHINASLAEDLGEDPNTVVQSVESLLEEQPAIQAAWTRQELRQSQSEAARLIRNSLTDHNSGELYLQTRPGCLVGGDSGTGHGSLYDYDRRVPLVFYGAGVRAGVNTEPAATIDIAPTLAPLLGLALPPGLPGTRRELSGSSGDH